MLIFNGKKVAENILWDLKKQITRKKIEPFLAIILVGENPTSKLYVKLKKEAGKRVGIKVVEHKFKKNTKEKDIVQKIKSLNKNKLVNGIIVQLPLPKGLNAERIIGALDPKKDVDGFHRKNLKLLNKGKPYFFPVLPLAIFSALKTGTKSTKGKKILALVNSDLFGKTLQDFFRRKGLKVDYFSKNDLTPRERKLITETADVVISICGYPRFIKGDMIKKKAILIDAGITKIKKRVKGDIEKKSVAKKAAFLTPVPGGIGPITVALLLKNVFLAAKNS